ncbi:hypothetical protein SAMN05660199_01767 [Klenkia soli]|uniref:Uncharacterized protein n=2 Tax=Klenkia soli TaxID=1052260 RepID=A0A1H0ITW3_9ACTN|nr:hypothetical protein SAMN05660199_01767 [Klenkia soli]
MSGMLEGLAAAREVLRAKYDIAPVDLENPVRRGTLYEAILELDGMLEEGADELDGRVLEHPDLHDPFPVCRPMEPDL